MKLFSTLAGGVLLLCATLSGHPAQAQTAQPDAAQQYLDNLVAPLDKAQVPTGLLAEYAMPLVPLDVFNGTLTDSSRTNPDGFRFIYTTAYSAWLGSGNNPLPTPLELNDRIKAAVVANGTTAIPVMVQHIDYASVRDDAFSSQLLSFQNDQLFDVAGRTQSPYLIKTLFAAAPATATTTSATGDATLIFPSGLDIERGVGSPMVLNVDFGDGQGYRNTPWDQPITAHYGVSGTWRIKVMVTYTAGPTRQPPVIYPKKGGYTTQPVYVPIEGATFESQFDLQVVGAPTYAARQSSSANATAGTLSYGDPEIIIPPSSVGLGHAGAKVTIHYASGHTSLIKPLIVVEGYDKNHIAPAVQDKNYDIDEFLSDIATQPSFNFRDALANGATSAAGAYDIVFIDFNNGTDDILRNANVFEEVLNQVQTLKVGTTPNVVMGMSMGGLIARYKLAEMSRAGRDPHTRLLVLQDSPQQGANVPLGLQALTRQMDFPLPGVKVVVNSSGVTVRALRTTDVSDFLLQGNLLLDEPATAQMLVHRATSATGGFSANTFLAGTYRNMIAGDTGPSQAYRIVAASQGSQCGQKLLDPYAELIRVNGEVGVTPMPWLVRGALSAEAIVNALPAGGQANRVSHLALKVRIRLFRFINITVPIIDRSYSCPAGLLAWDGVAGSTEDLVEGGISKQGHFNTWPISLVLHLPVVNASWNIQVQEKFTFLPTSSALDVPITSQAQLNGTFAGGIGLPTQPAVQSFIAQEAFNTTNSSGATVSANNKPHLAFTPRNTEWMYDMMEGLPLAGSYCAANCGAAGLPAISGPVQVCASAATFQLGATVAGAVSWSASPSGLFTNANGSGAQFSTAAVSGQRGQGTITATLPCGSTVTKTVNVGPAEPSGYFYGGNISNARLQTVQVVAPGQYSLFLDQPYNFTFTSSNSSVVLSSQSGRNTSFYLPLNKGVTIRATATNSECGYAGMWVFTNGTGSSNFTASPNPVATELLVRTLDPEPASASAEGSASPAAATFEAEFYDGFGRKVKTQRSSQGRAVLDVRDLPNGFYHVRVGSGKGSYTEHIQVVH